MSVFQHIHMPSLDGANGWLNSEPLGPAELRGQVVLVNFWTRCAGPLLPATSTTTQSSGRVIVNPPTSVPVSAAVPTTTSASGVDAELMRIAFQELGRTPPATPETLLLGGVT
jgi:hypothetical protein